MSTALLAFLSVGAPLQLVTVPTSTDAMACQALEAAVEVLARDPRVWVERRPGSITWVPAEEGGALELPTGRAPIRPERSLIDAVVAVAQWRELDVDPWSVAPSQAAWRAACEGRPEVYALAGSAITPAMLRTPMPPPLAPRSDLERFVDGVIAMKVGRARASWLDDWREALDRGATLPRWVAAERHPEAETAGVLPGGRVLFHEGGGFFAVEPESGALEIFDATGAPTEPTVASTPYGPIFLKADGVRWGEHLVALDAPFPELAVGPRRLYLANADEVRCLDLASGRTLWSHALQKPAVAGPVEAGEVVVVPQEDALLALGGLDGGLRWRAELADDLSAPLIPGQDVVWALAGARTVIGVDARTGRWGFRSEALPPIRQSLAFGARLFALAGAGELWSLEFKGEATQLQKSGAGALHPRPGLGGFVHRRGEDLVARSPVGTELWATEIEGRMTWTVDGLGLVLGDARAQWIDLRQGSISAFVPMASPGRDGVATSAGAVLLDGSGRLMALPRPEDPGRRRLEIFAARVLGEAHRQSGARGSALREAERLLARAPRDLGARLLRARARRRAELGDWLSVGALAPVGSDARAEALAAVEELGVRHLVPLPDAPKRIARVGPETVQLGELRWSDGQLAEGGEMPAPELDRDAEAAPSRVQIGGWFSEELYGRRLPSGDAALAVREGAWWWLRPDSRPKRLLRNPEAEVRAMDGGFAIVDGRQVYGVDAERGRLLGPVLLSSTPLRVEVLADGLIAQTAADQLERVEPLRVRRGSSWAFGRRLADWTTTGRIVVATEDAQLVELSAD